MLCKAWYIHIERSVHSGPWQRGTRDTNLLTVPPVTTQPVCSCCVHWLTILPTQRNDAQLGFRVFWVNGSTRKQQNKKCRYFLGIMDWQLVERLTAKTILFFPGELSWRGQEVHVASIKPPISPDASYLASLSLGVLTCETGCKTNLQGCCQDQRGKCTTHGTTRVPINTACWAFPAGIWAILINTYNFTYPNRDHTTTRRL